MSKKNIVVIDLEAEEEPRIVVESERKRRKMEVEVKVEVGGEVKKPFTYREMHAIYKVSRPMVSAMLKGKPDGIELREREELCRQAMEFTDQTPITELSRFAHHFTAQMYHELNAKFMEIEGVRGKERELVLICTTHSRLKHTLSERRIHTSAREDDADMVAELRKRFPVLPVPGFLPTDRYIVAREDDLRTLALELCLPDEYPNDHGIYRSVVEVQIADVMWRLFYGSNIKDSEEFW
jgi:hypothetical protein